MLPWLKAFALTQLIELPIHATALRHRRLWQRIVIGLLASTITHPFVWFLFPVLVPGRAHYWIMAALAETFAVFTEAAWLASFGVRRALLWSLGANAASFGIGMLLYALDLL